MNSANSASFTSVSDSKILKGWIYKTIPFQRTHSPRGFPAISRQNRTDKNIAYCPLKEEKTALRPFELVLFQTRHAFETFRELLFAKFHIRGKISLRRIVYPYPEGTALINHAMFLAKALWYSVL